MLGQLEVAAGAIPESGLRARLSPTCRAWRARELLSSPTISDEAHAEQYGYVNRLIDDDRPDSEVEAIAPRLARFDHDEILRTNCYLHQATGLRSGEDRVGGRPRSGPASSRREWIPSLENTFAQVPFDGARAEEEPRTDLRVRKPAAASWGICRSLRREIVARLYRALWHLLARCLELTSGALNASIQIDLSRSSAARS